jgi:hypothetical protein
MGSAATLLDGASCIVATLKFSETNYVTAQVHYDCNERCQNFFDCFHLRLPSMHPDFQLFCHLCHNAKGEGGEGGSGAVFSLLCGDSFNKQVG